MKILSKTLLNLGMSYLSLTYIAIKAVLRRFLSFSPKAMLTSIADCVLLILTGRPSLLSWADRFAILVNILSFVENIFYDSFFVTFCFDGDTDTFLEGLVDILSSEIGY